MPASELDIKINAFYGCTKLKHVRINCKDENDLINWLSHGYRCILGIPAKKYLIINNEEQQSITIPSGITKIQDSTFEDFVNITSITIPESVTSIGMGAFRGCSCLSSIIIPESVTSIGMEAFRGCSSLSSIIIPESVTSIGMEAFCACKRLTNVKILGSVVDIHEFAFRGIDNKLLHKTVELDWNDVKIGDLEIKIPKGLGGMIKLRFKNVYKWMNRKRNLIARDFPKLIVHYYYNHEPEIENPDVLSDASDLLTIKRNLAKAISEHGDASAIIKRLNEVDKKVTRIFIPQEKSQYIEYLEKNHALSEYPIVPIDEVFRKSGIIGDEKGKTKEGGALFTIIRDGQPYIIWENYNDSRATYVFRSTRENYDERMKLIFKFIMSDKEGKRQYLHTKACEEIFGERPMIVVHNNLESWSTRLMMMDVNSELVDHVEGEELFVEQREN